MSISTSLAGVRLEDFLKRMAKLSDFLGILRRGTVMLPETFGTYGQQRGNVNVRSLRST